MAIDDIGNRLQRIKKNIDLYMTFDPKEHLQEKCTENENGGVQISLSVGLNQNDIENKIYEKFCTLRAIKDIVKHRIEKDQKDYFENDLINRHTSLQIIADLANSYKHTYPLSRPRYSKKLHLGI